jgi:suppressor of G2 allele of SKP1
MASDAAKGQKALETNDYPAAITHLSAAIKATSSNATISPLWLIQRSTAYQRTGAYDKALKDAELAHYSATQRGRRELIATAHFRRAVAYHGLGQYGNARKCLIWTRKWNEKERALGMWQAKVAADYEKAGGDEAECNRITAVEAPPMTEREDIDAMFKQQAEKEKTVVKTKEVADTPAKREEPAAVAKPAGTTIDKIRVEWYQTNTNVTIEIFCKGIPKEDATVKFEEGQVNILPFYSLLCQC